MLRASKIKKNRRLLAITYNKKEDKMNMDKENKQQTEQPKDKKQDETKDWMELIADFIKNPVATGVTGLAAGYLIGTMKASKDMEAVKEEYKLQMKERDDQFKLLIKEMQITNRLIASGGMLKPEANRDQNALEMEEDQQTKVYKYKSKKKHIQLKG